MNSDYNSDDDPYVMAQHWLASFAAALEAQDVQKTVSLFEPEGHWRDLIGFDWNLSTHNGREAIAAMLERTIQDSSPRNFRLAPRRTAPRQVMRAGRQVIEAMFEFDTNIGAANGVIRLVPDPNQQGQARAWIVMTSLDSIRGHEELLGSRRPTGDDYSREFGGPNWLDKRQQALAYADRDPAVLVIGAGQAGLSIAARLGQLGIDTLMIDRNARVGDNWRNRYHSLTLHNEVHVNHLPYMPFPASWPVFIPKDKLAHWFEAYAQAMELNGWMGTELVGGEWVEQERRWTVKLKRSDGTIRTLKPRHLVFGTGVSAIAQRPSLPGLEQFGGHVLHSGQYTEGSAWKGRKVLVLGTGNSAHDVAQDLHCSGASVTLIQRSPTHVVSIREAQRVYSLYTEGLPLEDCDLLATALPYPALRRSYQLATALSRDTDQALRQGLERRGFRLTDGEDDTGFQMLYLRRGGGYYFNVGCSDLIVEGRIGLLQFADIERFVPEGALLRSGQIVPADLLVLATGYKNQQEVVRASLGNAIADRTGPAWDYDAGGELRNMWRPTGQPGLWFTAGSLAQCRIFSKFLALQILARELHLVR
jgi:cation diffusion facilitator CzcD-associated flavoprotein CzcO